MHISGNSDVAIAFWITEFKADYAVHFSLFWNALTEFSKKFPYYQKFVSDASKKTIKEQADP